MAAGLATRCPACGTVFRVVQDQLRVSEGWVRCGRCTQVFNAADALLEIEPGASAVDAGAVAEEPLQRSAHEPAGAFAQAEPESDEAPPQPDYAPIAQPPSPQPPAPRPAAPPKAPADFSAFDDPGPAAEPAPPAAPEAALAAAATEADPQADTATTPSFVRRAQQAQRWRQPRVRGALLALAVLGALGLLAQMAIEYRELVAARFAVTRPLLDQACEVLSCSVGAAHVIDNLSVESSGLVRVEKSSVYRLNVALRNRSSIEVALPALDLTLTDNQGKLLARRVLRAAELGVRQSTLAAGSDLALQGTLRADTDTIAGYTVEVFYP